MPSTFMEVLAEVNVEALTGVVVKDLQIIISL